MSATDVAAPLLAWFDRHGRHDLPWQSPRTPYRVWLSEIMLQQTQVQTVVPYFERFVADVPTLADLAAAEPDRVLALWSGLGYYSRARNLHRAARLCVERHGGELPRDVAQLTELPGIGRSTAAAILAQAYGDRHAILDGNVKRVLARLHGVRGWPGLPKVQSVLWRHAEAHTPNARLADYTQAIMDLGATVCTRSRPACALCPLSGSCVARREGSTAALPEPKPAKAVPTRATTMLVVRDADGRVLLERRPEAGVWAALFSLPECGPDEASISTALDRIGVVAHRVATLPPFAHAFSHYRLEVQPLLFALDREIDRVGESAVDRVWLARDALATLGLPAPVRKLLDRLPEETPWPEPCNA